MKIGMLGAGAMGGLFASDLVKSNDVHLIDKWEEHVKRINERGLLKSKKDDNKVEIIKIPATTDSKEVGICDLVIVLVKSTETTEALTKHAVNLIGKDTIVATFQNGYGNDSEISKFVNKENIVIGTTERGALIEEPGWVMDTAGISNHVGPLGFDLSKAKTVAEVLNKAELSADVKERSQVPQMVWQKLIMNASVNGMTALLHVFNGFIADNGYAEKSSRRLIEEAVAVCNKAIGANFDANEMMEGLLKHFKNVVPRHVSSMYQHMERKLLTEIDRINGAVVQVGKEVGIKTPYNEFFVDLIHAKEGTYFL